MKRYAGEAAAADVQGEFDRFEMTNKADGITGPQRSELRRKHNAIKELRDRAMSNVSASKWLLDGR